MTRTALLVVDMLTDFFIAKPGLPVPVRMAPLRTNTQRVRRKAREKGIPVVFAGVVFASIVGGMVMSIGHRYIAGSFGQNRYANAELLRSFESNTTALYLWLAVPIAGLFLWFAFVNHRSTERRVARAALQAVALVITAFCGLALPLILYTS